uniref:Uncharacterized protein n=1 Tax=Meloidogyne hapla TaxID=6305 RepID=A0A1I8BK75_MELHA
MAIFAIFSLQNYKPLIRMPKSGGAREKRKSKRPVSQKFTIAPPNRYSQKLVFINDRPSSEKSFFFWQFNKNVQLISKLLARFIFNFLFIMPAISSLGPPVYEPGLSYTDYTQKCRNAGYVPNWPRSGQTMAEYLPNSIGRLWPPTWTRDIPRRQAEGLLLLVWENLRYRGKRLPQVEPKLSPPAWATIIQPGVSVEDYFVRKGQTLDHPQLPCLITIGGVRGSSRRSRQRELATGHQCWKFGELHEDYLPLEFITYEPDECPEPNSSSASERPVHAPIPDQEPAHTPEGPGEIGESKNEDVLRIIIPRTLCRKSITIIFSILSLCFVIGACEPAREIPNLSLCLVILPRINYFPSDMPKRPTTQSQRDIKKARESAYISTFGKPQSVADQEEMDRLVASCEDIPRPDNDKIWKENSHDPQGTSNQDLEEDLSNTILPIATQIENENLINGQQQQKQPIDNQQLQQQVMTTVTKPSVQYQLAPVTTVLAQQQNTSISSGQNSGGESEGKSSCKGISKDPIKTETTAQERLTEALLACVQKLSGISAMAVPPPAHFVSKGGEGSQNIPFSQVCGTSSSAIVPHGTPSINKPPVPVIPLANLRGAPAEAGRRPFRSAPQIRGLVEHHLRGLRNRADQLANAAATALNEVEEENREGRAEEYTQDILAIEGATARLVKSIRTAFSRLPPR